MKASEARVFTAVAPAPYVQIPLFCQLTGYTPKAVERKIESGVWVEGREWRKASDGHRLISMEGYKRWVEKEAA